MNIALLLFAILLPQIATAQSTIALQDVLTKRHDDGKFPMTQRYCGKFTQQYDEDVSIRLPFADANYEIKHVNYRTTEAKERKQLVYVSGERTDKTKGTISASFIVRRSIPDFETLKSIKTIKEFENELGSMGDAIGAWGVNDVLHSSKHWSGCTLDSSGNLRCVDVFLHTVNRGSGWEIDIRHIYEGAFSPRKVNDMSHDQNER